MEHDDGLCRPAVARPCDLCRSRRLCGRGALLAFRHRPMDRAAWPPSPSRRPAARSSAFSHSASASAGSISPSSPSPSPNSRASASTISAGSAARAACSCRSPITPSNDLWNLRGNPTMFYYVMLALTVAAFVLCHVLLRSRIGYYWQAIREDEAAARSLGINTFRYKMIAVVISAGMTAVAGVFFAFYYNNLFPEQVFTSRARSRSSWVRSSAASAPCSARSSAPSCSPALSETHAGAACVRSASTRPAPSRCSTACACWWW